MREDLPQSSDEAVALGAITKCSPVATFTLELEKRVLQLGFAGDGGTEPARDSLIDLAVFKALHRASESGGRSAHVGGLPAIRGSAEDLENVVAYARPPKRAQEREDQGAFFLRSCTTPKSQRRAWRERKDVKTASPYLLERKGQQRDSRRQRPPGSLPNRKTRTF